MIILVLIRMCSLTYPERNVMKNLGQPSPYIKRVNQYKIVYDQKESTLKY